MTERRIGKISIDRWEEDAGTLRLVFETGSTMNVVWVTDADLDELVRVIKAYRIAQAFGYPLLPPHLEAKFQDWAAQQDAREA